MGQNNWYISNVNATVGSSSSHIVSSKITNNNSSNYTVKSGSTIIELKPEFIKTLENGDHNLTASFDITDVSAYFKCL